MKTLFRSLSAFVLCASTLGANALQFENIVGMSTKTGFRGVFAWQADTVMSGIVEYQINGGQTKTAFPLLNAVDRAQMVIVDGLEPGQTVTYRIRDQLSGTTSTQHSFTAGNAYESWNGSNYRLNALVQLDSQALPDGIPFDLGVGDLADGMKIVAERLYDAMDGYAQMGTVIVTDTVLNYPLNLPFGVQSVFGDTGCGDANVDGIGAVGHTLADFIVETSIPFDSHTFSGWMVDNPCVGFYIGRVGQLVVPWEDDLHLGYTMTHELMHYAFNAPDLYLLNSDADCRNLDWDGSLMHNTGGWTGERWELTELDRDPVATPCQHGTAPYTWQVLRERYDQIPQNSNPQNVVDSQARGNPTGGSLEIWVLDHEPGNSRLCRYGTAGCFDSN